MNIRFRNFEPLPTLLRYVDKIWLFESDGPLPVDDMKLIVPNGRLLLILPVRNAITGTMKGESHFVNQNRLALVGMCDNSSIVDAAANAPLATIGVEISPTGAYRFFHLRLKEIKNKLYYLSDILGDKVNRIEERIAELPSYSAKVCLLLQFLCSLAVRSTDDLIFEHCVGEILKTKGAISISSLESSSGYTSRWLNMKFEERLGISPKSFGSIIRFNAYYQALVLNGRSFFSRKDFYDHYYDEAHFIREFKRFTGMPPSKLIRSKNDFGLMFYQE